MLSFYRVAFNILNHFGSDACGDFIMLNLYAFFCFDSRTRADAFMVQFNALAATAGASSFSGSVTCPDVCSQFFSFAHFFDYTGFLGGLRYPPKGAEQTVRFGTNTWRLYRKHSSTPKMNIKLSQKQGALNIVHNPGQAGHHG